MSARNSRAVERRWQVAALIAFKREGEQDYYLVRWEVSTLSEKELCPFLHLAQDVRWTGNEAIFRIVWQDTWEPVTQLSDAGELIHKYWMRYLVSNT